jgi:hypothetical protein
MAFGLWNEWLKKHKIPLGNVRDGFFIMGG